MVRLYRVLLHEFGVIILMHLKYSSEREAFTLLLAPQARDFSSTHVCVICSYCALVLDP